MHRVLERLDAAGSTLVPLLYLAGLTLGTLSYFTGVTADFGIAVGVGLAAAAELHSFLQQRRVRAGWGLLARTVRDDPRRPGLVTQFRVNVAVLVALVAFSTYNAMAFAAATWHPAAGFLPTWAQITVRGLVVPCFFLLSGFLSPLQADAGMLLAGASHDMLHKTVTVTVRQWKQRVDRAKRQGLDLAPVAIALMEDSGHAEGAGRIRLIAAGLDAAERGGPFPPAPPTGPGTPVAAVVDADAGGSTSLAIVPRRRAIPARVRMGRNPDAIERIARRFWQPGMGVRELARLTGMSTTAASKWCKVLAAEGPGEDDAQGA